MSDCGSWQGESAPGGASAVRVFPGELAALPEVIRFVIEQGHQAELAADDCARLAIVIEELFINSVTHGRLDAGPGGDSAVRLAIDAARPGRLALDYQDRGTAFNPLTDGPALPASNQDAASYLGERIGGVGLWLLRHCARSPSYERTGAINRLRFWLGTE